MKATFMSATLLLFASTQIQAAEGDRMQAQLSGSGITGTVTMLETASGVILVQVKAQGVPEGAHGIHVHEIGWCEDNRDFESAGGHLARGLQHGFKVEGGPHPGDLPNIYAQSDGIVEADFFVRGFTLGEAGNQRIRDDDGSSVIIHQGPDDYESQPSGASGARLACGVLERAQLPDVQ